MPAFRQRGKQPVAEAARVPVGQLTRHIEGVLEDLVWCLAAHALDGQAGRHPPDPPGDPHHEELVERAGEDGLEPDPLEQRHIRVLGELEHALAEPQPALLTVQKPAGGQLRQLAEPVAHRGDILADSGQDRGRALHAVHARRIAQSSVGFQACRVETGVNRTRGIGVQPDRCGLGGVPLTPGGPGPSHGGCALMAGRALRGRGAGLLRLLGGRQLLRRRPGLPGGTRCGLARTLPAAVARRRGLPRIHVSILP